MKKNILWSSILLLTFATGVAVTIIWFNFHFNDSTGISNDIIAIPTILSNDSAALGKETMVDLPILSFCELANSPEKYDGKVIRLNAAVNMLNIHGYTIFDSAKCSEAEDFAKSFGAIKFSNEQDSETINSIFRDNLPKSGWYKSVNIIARAKFSYAKSQKQASDSAWDRTPLHFEILNLETVSVSKE